MINLPKSTQVKRFIPKEKLYNQGKVSSSLRQAFVDQVDKITLTNVISPNSLNITSKDYEELQVIEIKLKTHDLDIKVLKHIDTHIPYPILFVIVQQNSVKATIAYKEPNQKNINDMKVDSYYSTDWQQDTNLDIKGGSVDEVYKNFLKQIDSSISQDSSLSTRQAVEYSKEQKAIQKQIDTLSKKIKNEPSIGKRHDLITKRGQLKKILKG